MGLGPKFGASFEASFRQTCHPEACAADSHKSWGPADCGGLCGSNCTSRRGNRIDVRLIKTSPTRPLHVWTEKSVHQNHAPQARDKARSLKCWTPGYQAADSEFETFHGLSRNPLPERPQGSAHRGFVGSASLFGARPRLCR